METESTKAGLTIVQGRGITALSVGIVLKSSSSTEVLIDSTDSDGNAWSNHAQVILHRGFMYTRVDYRVPLEMFESSLIWDDWITKYSLPSSRGFVIVFPEENSLSHRDAVIHDVKNRMVKASSDNDSKTKIETTFKLLDPDAEDVSMLPSAVETLKNLESCGKIIRVFDQVVVRPSAVLKQLYNWLISREPHCKTGAVRRVQACGFERFHALRPNARHRANRETEDLVVIVGRGTMPLVNIWFDDALALGGKRNEPFVITSHCMEGSSYWLLDCRAFLEKNTIQHAFSAIVSLLSLHFPKVNFDSTEWMKYVAKIPKMTGRDGDYVGDLRSRCVDKTKSGLLCYSDRFTVAPKVGQAILGALESAPMLETAEPFENNRQFEPEEPWARENASYLAIERFRSMLDPQTSEP